MAKVLVALLFAATIVLGAVLNQRMIRKATKAGPLFSLRYLIAGVRTPEFYLFPFLVLLAFGLFFVLQSLGDN